MRGRSEMDWNLWLTIGVVVLILGLAVATRRFGGG